MPNVKLRIADIPIIIKSDFPIKEPLPINDGLLSRQEDISAARYKSFFYKGNKKPEINIKVKIGPTLPDFGGKTLFVTTHFQDGKENWRILKKGSSFVYKSTLDEKKQVMLINKDYNRIEAYLLPKKNLGSYFAGEGVSEPYSWNSQDIIYDFLQVLLINYLSSSQVGMIVHSVGIKDADGSGLLFAGKSGAGKSTTARIWHKNSKATILNDDRVVVRKKNGRFFIHGSPWHGDFNDYLETRVGCAPLKKIFFIYHSTKNTVKPLSKKEAFPILFPSLFPAFWDKEGLHQLSSFALELLDKVPSYYLGFVNNKDIIGFVRKIR